MANTWNIAHRGGAALRPENTLGGFPNAIALGCDGAELDVQLSADGVVVVHHDFRLNPGLTRKDGAWLTGETPRIKDLTFAELQRFRSGPRRSRQRLCARRIPLLAPGTARGFRPWRRSRRCRRSFLLLVELKSSTDPASADPVALADAALGGDEGSTRTAPSLSASTGAGWRGSRRERRRALLVHHRQAPGRCAPGAGHHQGGRRRWLVSLLSRTPRRRLWRMRARCGLQVGAWTVNEPDEMTTVDRPEAGRDLHRPARSAKDPRTSAVER